MSTEKKNKGRNPEALELDSPVSRLVRKFIEMVETDYMRSVVIPVLEADGFTPIDYHHGNTEIGKDVICYRDKGFGKKALVTVVVKSDKFSKTSSDSSGLPVFLVQVTQAKKNRVISWDGTLRFPDEVLVILADDPSHDIITSSPDHFSETIKVGVSFINGSEVAERLLLLRPEIAEQILQCKLDTSAFLANNPTNLPLLHALNSTETIDIQEFFSELDAVVGSTSMAEAFSLVPQKSAGCVSVPEVSWSAVSTSIKQFEDLLGTVLLKPLVEIEKSFVTSNKKAKSAANVRLFNQLMLAIDELIKWMVSSEKRFNNRPAIISEILAKSTGQTKMAKPSSVLSEGLDIASDLAGMCRQFATQLEVFRAEPNIQKSVGQMLVELNDVTEQLLDASSSLKDLRPRFEKEGNHSALLVFAELEKAIEETSGAAQTYVSDFKVLPEAVADYVQPEDYEIAFNVDEMDNRLRSHVESLGKRFHSPEVAANRLYSRSLLEDTRRYLTTIDRFTHIKELSNVLAPVAKSDNRETHLGACVLGLLNSGIDVLLVGNAGSGKTTTLDMFSRRRYSLREVKEEVFFVPLSRVVSADGKVELSDPLQRFCDVYANLIRSAQPGVSSQLVWEKIEAAKRIILVLDGVDEAVGLTGWIVNVINGLRAIRGCSLQVVASSRFAVPQLSEVGLIGIHLLPFRQEQVTGFIKNFLRSDSVLAGNVIDHVESNPVMLSVVRTPLMATILCVLAKNGVVLPETRFALYKERFELLWGAYDAKKQIRRVRSSKSCLEDVSKKIAYFLHGRNRRSAPRDELSNYVITSLKRRYAVDKLDCAIDELEQPCNVLFPEFDGSLGFDHLSYQEYLAADELYSNHQSEIVSRLTDPWWRGVLVLVAQTTDDIGQLIQDRIIGSGCISGASETLAAMIDSRENPERNRLRRLLQEHAKLDGIDEFSNAWEEY